jgi:glycosyltransferase involved in cell wall biosynthesis
MKILLLNWKDQHHPLAGGAEDYTFNILKRLAQRGHEITWFTSAYDGGLPESDEAGIHYVRRGSYQTVHYKARSYLRSITPESKPDVVIDEVNTRPFSPAKYLRVKVRIFNLIHQLAREVWFNEVPLPLAIVGRYVLEDRWLRGIARFPTITVSESTRSDLISLGFADVRIVHNALSKAPPELNNTKDKPPLLIFCGRLTKGKRPDDALRAFRIVRSSTPCSMTVIGSGPLLSKLKERYPEVTFLGHVTDSVKADALRRAMVMLTPGTREGWGRVVLEGQASGVVPVVYNVNGLRDAVDFGNAGVLLSSNTPEAMGAAVIELLRDNEVTMKLSRAGRTWSAQFTYDKSADDFEKILSQHGKGVEGD